MTRFRLEDSRAVANCIGWFAKAIQYVGEISRIRPTSTEDDVYFGEYLQAQKEALYAKGSELGLAVTLFSLIVSTRAERAIEIGRFKGFSTLALASGLRFNDWGWSEPQEHFQRKDGVSPEEFHSPKTRRLYSIDSGPKIHAYELIKRNNLSRYVEFVNGDSREVNLDVVADVLFVDGDHSYGDAGEMWTDSFRRISVRGAISSCTIILGISIKRGEIARRSRPSAMSLSRKVVTSTSSSTPAA